MSAFIVDRKTINRIVTWLDYELAGSGVLRYSIEALAEQYDIDLTNFVWQAMLATDMFRLNYEAVNVRYSEKHGPDLEFEYDPLYERSRFQILKSLQCWLYQCNEGDINQKPLYRFFEELSHTIALDIVTDSPEYSQAKWG